MLQVLLSCMTGEADPEQMLGPIKATRAVRTEIQRFKIDHGLKTANDVIVFLLKEHNARVNSWAELDNLSFKKKGGD